MRPLKILKDVNCWAIAFFYVVLVVIGWYMVGLSFFDRWYHDSLTAHKSLGMIMLFLVLIRLFWLLFVSRFTNPIVPIKSLKRYNLIFFYSLMAVINITGYLVSASAGDSVKIFSFASFPSLLSLKKNALELVISLHYYLAYGSIALILLHSLITHRPRILSRLKSR